MQRLAAELNTKDLEHADHKLELIDALAVVVERHYLLALGRLLDKRGALQLPGDGTQGDTYDQKRRLADLTAASRSLRLVGL